MISLSGFISRELDKQDKLPEKFNSLAGKPEVLRIDLKTSDDFILTDCNGLILKAKG